MVNLIPQFAIRYVLCALLWLNIWLRLVATLETMLRKSNIFYIKIKLYKCRNPPYLPHRKPHINTTYQAPPKAHTPNFIYKCLQIFQKEKTQKLKAEKELKKDKKALHSRKKQKIILFFHYSRRTHNQN